MKKAQSLFSNNANLKGYFEGIDNVEIHPITKALLKCIACYSEVSSILDAGIREDLEEFGGYNAKINDIIRQSNGIIEQIESIFVDVIEQNMYQSNFKQI